MSSRTPQPTRPTFLSSMSLLDLEKKRGDASSKDRKRRSSISSIDTHTSTSSSSSTSDKPLLNPLALSSSILPDLRFEQSYLASIRGYVHELEHEAAQDIKAARKEGDDLAEKTGGANLKEGEKGERLVVDEASQSGAKKVQLSKSPKGEPELWLGSLRIEWVPLLYLTIRDQLLSPLIQGAVWGLAGIALVKARQAAVVVARVGLREAMNQSGWRR
ncbi:hypothetical protein IE81DRAFT_345446 [Ceraceosorus guamensis]|uniref:DUF1770-domain-containing protein n=1 Tax=Ceraceosorus guamensis TaxID=1522189 RepID=A0A316W569_9BASI|nr:hypothetical protein IE81DRAFT_345446 [Ceraceosorus guamensis]PWN44754.1 hypothetical protein IE81DRAFT_345446 [Ceraceosorus guamensis]